MRIVIGVLWLAFPWDGANGLLRHPLPALQGPPARSSAGGQEAGKPKAAPPAGVDQKRVDDAIRKGVAYLKTQEAVPATDPGGHHATELVLYPLSEASHAAAPGCRQHGSFSSSETRVERKERPERVAFPHSGIFFWGFCPHRELRGEVSSWAV